LYWEYESWIKKREAAFKTVIGAAGELFAMRTELYEPIPEHIILDDFYISLRLCLKGYTINYAANAFATEAPTTSIGEEEKRKIRIAAGAFQVVSTIQWKGLLKQPLIAFQFFSRRWLRWLVCPFALPLILFLNIVLVINESPFLYTLLLVLQVFFYLVALVGAMTINNRKLVPATAFFYFLFMNYCLLKGLLLYLRKKQTVLWPKAARQV
jgi:cellulose synthase/poly-beta-1,6-N-acetylglucosamine synthase-like glycosyltransferase